MNFPSVETRYTRTCRVHRPGAHYHRHRLVGRPLPAYALTRQALAPGDGHIEHNLRSNLLINPKHIGDWVLRVIVDTRTLDRSAIVWDDEISLARALETADRVSGESETLRAARGNVRMLCSTASEWL